ncbi:3-carboxy-cis,cis-muconate cycloisomerase [Noviherbaspirillum saxi]|uniref:3-carboxy-cis,cis-muconate cycloisomerase n=1 Tax=Noviherbaspirillum saxi TaxID=2320863 RepID=A0A3A3GE75_9BURK|nr:3-carboxy-cis,cis-muconate cycloisomerase [Noviherbaspirillum saxi]RJF99209.1 3-carboxy-cis,cis-muconate cycloisomerase [Noviherbaspirillum saxi]
MNELPDLPFSSLTRSMFSTPAMRQMFSARASVQGMLDFEAALARAQARVGVIPQSAVEAIVHACDASRIDLAGLAQHAAASGNLAIPLVKQLTAVVAQTDKEASKYVHWGATSQDAIDTGLILQLRRALALITQDLDALIEALAVQAQQHRTTTVVGRTWMQHALPVTFGLKAAGWLDAALRHRERLAALTPRLLVLQFGGAAGTLASLGDKGEQVAQALAEELALTLPDMPWHTQRDRVVECATVLGMLTGSLGKMARDISLMMQTDVGEVAEPAGEGRGGSSTMPHKRNPVACAAVLACATRMPALVSTMLSGMVQEHERALGAWQAEWDTLPDIVQLAAGALHQMRDIASGMTVDAVRMRHNLDMTHGLIMAEAVTLALGATMGRLAAHQAVEAACHHALKSGRHLRDALLADPAISAILPPERIDELLDPSHYLGQATSFVDRVLHRARRALVFVS